MNEPDRKVYLGDGVYMTLTAVGDVVLTTENGIEVSNRIVLEQEVLEMFVSTLRRRILLKAIATQ